MGYRLIAALESIRSSRTTPEVAATLIVVVAMAAACASWLCWRATFSLEIDGNEAWNAWHSNDAFRSSLLYPPVDSLTNNNYPPLSFLILRSFSPLFANPIEAGRFLSILSMLVAGGAVFSCARRLGADPPEAAVGGAWFVATIALAFTRYAGMNDPNLLGLAIAAWGFALFLYARKPSAIYSAFALMAAAGFVKHNLITLPFSAFVYLAIARRQLATRAALFGLALCAIMVVVASAVYGPNFQAQMLAPRQFLAWTPWNSLRHLEWVAPVWFFWLFAQTSDENDRARVVVPIAGCFGLASWAIWRMGAGVDENAQFDLVFATALAVAMTLSRFRRLRIGRLLFGFAVVVRLLTAPETGPWLWLSSSAYRAEVAAKEEIADREIARVRRLTRPVACSMQNICYLAGKAFVFDDFWVGQRLLTGRVQKKAIESATQNIRFEKIDPRAHWGS